MEYLSNRNGVGVVFYLIVCIGTATGLDPLPCSCYSFYGDSNSWEESRSLCQSSGGDLVSIETRREWEFIRNQTEGHVTDSGANQWWIGLQKRNMHWMWLSNNPLTYNDTWAYILLPERQKSSYIFAVIEKGSGQYWKAVKAINVGRICEYKGQICTVNQTEWCEEELTTTTSRPIPSTTTSSSPSTTTTTTATATTTARAIKVTTETQEMTLTEHNPPTITSSNEGNKDERSVGKRKKPFPIVVFMVVLAVILLLCVGILILVWINKTRKRGKHKLSHRRHKPNTKMEVKFDVKNMYDQYSEYSSGHYENASSPQNCTSNKAHSNHHITSTATKDPKKEAKVSQVSDDFLSETKYEEIDEQPFTKTGVQQTPDVEPPSEDSINNAEAKVDLKTFGKSQDNNDDDVFYTEIETAQRQLQNGDLGSLPNENSSDIFIYAAISDSNDKKPSEKLYEEVDDLEKTSTSTDDKEVTYAEISDFNANADVPLRKPTPYSRTEYASVTLHPLSPREFDR